MLHPLYRYFPRTNLIWLRKRSIIMKQKIIANNIDIYGMKFSSRSHWQLFSTVSKTIWVFVTSLVTSFRIIFWNLNMFRPARKLSETNYIVLSLYKFTRHIWIILYEFNVKHLLWLKPELSQHRQNLKRIDKLRHWDLNGSISILVI